MQRKHLFSNSSFATGILAVAVAASSSAFGAGFEKNVLWSGKWVGVGGAAVSGVQGAESLFFNPAGLAGRQGFEVSGNFSPTWGKFEGPTGTSGQTDSTGYKFSPVFGALADYGITPQWSVGVGSFVSAGTKADYGNVGDFNALLAGFNPEIKSDIYVIEYSIGTAYELIPGLKVGGAWRIAHVSAGVATVYPAGASYSNAVINDLSATRYNGFRAGVQYTSQDNKWGLGVSYRSNVDFTAKSSNATVKTFGVGTTNVNDVTVATALPTQIEIGGNYAIFDTVRAYLDYVWTNYSHDQTISVTGGGIPDIQQGWTNMSNVRFGLACTAVQDWTFRAGYVYTSQVTPKTLARPTFSSPGMGNTVTVGAGTSILNKSLDLDAAVEHSWASGTTTAADQGPLYYSSGDYSSSDWALHLGATYRL